MHRVLGLVQKVDLDTIFELQEAAVRENLTASALLGEIVPFLSLSVAINFEVLHEMSFEATKQTAIRHFGTDTLSHIVVAIRLGLWGAVPESLSVLRGALESGAQLEFMVNQSLYATALKEASTKFVKLSYKRVKAELGELGNSVGKLHGRISELAAHSTPRRFRLLEYEFQGVKYDRLGFAVDPIGAEHIAHTSMLSLAWLFYCLAKAHEQDGLQLRLGQDISAWRAEFERLSSQFQERMKDEGSPSPAE